MPPAVRIFLSLAALLVPVGCADMDGDCSGAFAGLMLMNTNDTGVGSIRVKNNGKWCAFGITAPTAGIDGHIVSDPEHGTARVVRRPDKLVIGYLPDVGYSGSDRFKVVISPGNVGLQMSVSVLP